LAQRSTGGVKAIDPAKGPPSANRLEQYLADLNRPVGGWFSSREDLMVEICVSVADVGRVSGLMRRLATLFDRSSVSFDRSRKEVRVKSEWESRGVVRVVEAVEAWLEEDGVEAATLSIGDRSYTLAGPTLASASR
jgi:hypothetical protein